MTPGDVMDAIIHDDRITHARDVLLGQRDQCSDAIAVFSSLMDFIRPEPDAKQWLPLSPLEIDRLRVALRTVADAINVAQARSPVHFRIVAEGER